jgi:hypothetical protein
MTSSIPKTVNLNKYIELRDHRPHIRGRRLPVIFVAAALLYYREHKAQIDAQDTIDAQQSLEMHRRYGKQLGQA